MKIVVTGHRPLKNGIDYDLVSPMVQKIEKRIIEIFGELNPESGICGMALGIDTLFAKICLQHNIPLVAAIPCKNQSSRWPRKSVDLYNMILAHPLTTVHYVSEKDYFPECMQIRNIWMIDQMVEEDRLLAVWNGSSGGTRNCVEYARDTDKEIIIINPKTL